MDIAGPRLDCLTDNRVNQTYNRSIFDFEIFFDDLFIHIKTFDFGRCLLGFFSFGIVLIDILLNIIPKSYIRFYRHLRDDFNVI